MSFAWLPVDVEILNSHKTRRLMRRLSLDTPAHAVGYLVCLWTWAMVHAPDGDLSHLDAEDIAGSAGWMGEPEAFVDALTDARWIDKTPAGLVIHEWEEHQGQSFRQRVNEAAKKRKQRAASGEKWGSWLSNEGDAVGTPAGQDGDINGTGVPDKTRQDKTLKEKDLAAKPAAAKPGSTEEGKPAQRIVAHYVDCHERQGRTKPDGRLIGKMAKAAKERLDAGASERVVMAAVELLVEKAFDPTTLANFVSQVEREGWKPDPDAEAAYLSQRIAGVVG